MSVEAILTVVAVALAVMALIPQERAQDLQVRLGGRPLVGVVTAALLILYWALLEELHALPIVELLPRPISWPRRWGPASVSLVVIVAVAAAAYWSYRRPLPVYRVPRLKIALANALARRRYGECIHLIENHLRSIAKAHEGDYWQARLRLQLAPTVGELFTRAHAQVDKNRSDSQQDKDSTSPVNAVDDLPSHIPFVFPTVQQRGPLVRRFARWADLPRDGAQEIVRLVSLAPALATEIASANPYLGIAILRIPSTWLYREFAEDFARALVRDQHSAFYRELRHAQNIDSRGWIEVDGSAQPLLKALCDDAVRRDGPLLVYTFINAGIDPVRWASGQSLRDVLSGPLGDFDERGQWSSPPFAAMYLLKIIAPRVAVTPNAPLLNLYIVRTLVTALLSQLNPEEEIDGNREWPTPTHYLLYEIVTLLRDLVRMLKERPDSLDAVRGATSNPEAITLPDHAIHVLGSVMYECMKSEKLDTPFKGYLLGVWWPVYVEKYEGAWPGSERVLEAFARGGEWGEHTDHRSAVAEALNYVDVVRQHSKGADALRARLRI